MCVCAGAKTSRIAKIPNLYVRNANYMCETAEFMQDLYMNFKNAEFICTAANNISCDFSKVQIICAGLNANYMCETSDFGCQLYLPLL